MTTVLAVDDSEADQFLCALAFEEYDPLIEVLTAADGEEALELLTRVPSLPDLILLDINMPRMNGFEFLEAFNGHYPGVVVVLLTSSFQEADRERARTFDVVRGYLHKPIDHAKIAQLVQGL